VPYYVVVCGLFGYPIFFQIISQNEKIITAHKMCVLIFSTTFSETLAILRLNLYINIKVILLYVKY